MSPRVHSFADKQLGNEKGQPPSSGWQDKGSSVRTHGSVTSPGHSASSPNIRGMHRFITLVSKLLGT